MSESKAKERRKLEAVVAAAQPQVLVTVSVQYLENNSIAVNFPETPDKRLIAQYVKMLLDAANIIIGQRLVPLAGEGGRIYLPPGTMNGYEFVSCKQ